MVEKKFVSVFLRSAVGLLSKKIAVPPSCLTTEFKVPVFTDLKLADYRNVQDYIKPTEGSPVLIFRWDGKTKLQGIPLMDLKDVYLS